MLQCLIGVCLSSESDLDSESESSLSLESAIKSSTFTEYPCFFFVGLDKDFLVGFNDLLVALLDLSKTL
jgi:hypothetical protein